MPLPPAVAAILRSIPQQEASEYVFTTTGKTPISGFSDAKEKVAKAANLDGWRLHDLRRSAATNMAALGVTKATIKRVLGHAETDVTETYVRYDWLAEKRGALERWAAHLERVVRDDGAAAATAATAV